MNTSLEDVMRPTSPTYCKKLRNLHMQDAYVSLVRCDEQQSNSPCVNDFASPYPCTSLSTSSYTTNSPCLLQFCASSSNGLCNSTSERPTISFYSSTSMMRKADDSPLIRSISSSSDEDMNVSSPDSGFESIAAVERPVVDFTDDELWKLPSTSSPSPHPLNLVPPPPPKPAPKVEVKVPTIVCKWKNCTSTFTSHQQLQNHIGVAHVELTKDRFSCLWIGCRSYDKPARSIKWLRTHVALHTGQKRFQCILEGCGVWFSTPGGVARHIHSHFNESNIPKARVNGNMERKCLVKKRRIKDKTKALANIHDVMDQRCQELMKKYLVQKAENDRKPNHVPAACKRIHEDGSLWCLSDSQQRWFKDNCAYKNPDEGLFLSRPAKRCRKYKAIS